MHLKSMRLQANGYGNFSLFFYPLVVNLTSLLTFEFFEPLNGSFFYLKKSLVIFKNVQTKNMEYQVEALFTVRYL